MIAQRRAMARVLLIAKDSELRAKALDRELREAEAVSGENLDTVREQLRGIFD